MVSHSVSKFPSSCKRVSARDSSQSEKNYNFTSSSPSLRRISKVFNSHSNTQVYYYLILSDVSIIAKGGLNMLHLTSWKMKRVMLNDNNVIIVAHIFYNYKYYSAVRRGRDISIHQFIITFSRYNIFHRSFPSKKSK